MKGGGGGGGGLKSGNHADSPSAARRVVEIRSVTASIESAILLTSPSMVFSIALRYDIRSSSDPKVSPFQSGIWKTLTNRNNICYNYNLYVVSGQSKLEIH